MPLSMRKFYTMDETGMQNTHMTNRLKQFSKEVFEFTKHYMFFIFIPDEM